MAQVNTTITLTPGTPQRVATVRTIASSVTWQMLHGGSGIGYVMINPTHPIPSKSNASDLSFELAAATASAPGGSAQQENVDLSQVWVDGDQADPMKVTYNVQVGPGV